VSQVSKGIQFNLQLGEGQEKHASGRFSTTSVSSWNKQSPIELCVACFLFWFSSWDPGNPPSSFFAMTCLSKTAKQYRLTASP